MIKREERTMKDTRLRAQMVKKYKIAWVGDDVETADRILAKLDDTGKRQLIKWHESRGGK